MFTQLCGGPSVVILNVVKANLSIAEEFIVYFSSFDQA